MKVSIVVPAYNEEHTIAKTLEGLKKQTYKEIELIVVNNNSKDKTGEIAEQYCDNVFLETKPGYINAVRRGAKEATGDIIAFCDADSVYPQYWLELAVKTFEKNPDAVVVYGTADTYDASVLGNYFNGLFYSLFLRISRSLGLDNTSGFNFLMKKDIYEKVGGYDPAYQKMSPDIELGKRLKEQGKIVFVPSLKVSSSHRRFKEGGKLKTTFMFIKAWWSMLRNRLPEASYDEYNQGAPN